MLDAIGGTGFRGCPATEPKGCTQNPLADCFAALLERFCETGEAASFAGLVDSMPVILARPRTPLQRQSRPRALPTAVTARPSVCIITG